MPEKLKGTSWEFIWKVINVLMISIIIPGLVWIITTLTSLQAKDNLIPRYSKEEAKTLKIEMQQYTNEHIEARINALRQDIFELTKVVIELKTIIKDKK